MAFLTGVEIKTAYAAQLKEAGHSVSIDVPVGDGEGAVDILTEREIIFCAPTLTQKSALSLKYQLGFYGKFSPSWQKVAVVQQVVDKAAAQALSKDGIRIVELSVDALTEQDSVHKPNEFKPNALLVTLQRALASSTMRPVVKPIKGLIARDPAFDQTHGVAELKAVLIAVSVIFVIGAVGVGASLVRSQALSSPPVPSPSSHLRLSN